MSEIVTHQPAPGADFVIRVDLTDHGMPGRGEQLWASRIDTNRFVPRSLPFFSYGFRFGDELETDEHFIVHRLVSASGRSLLRVAAQKGFEDRIHDDLHPLLERLELLHEWHRIGYVSIDLASTEIPSDLRSVLVDSCDNGLLHYELA